MDFQRQMKGNLRQRERETAYERDSATSLNRLLNHGGAEREGEAFLGAIGLERARLSPKKDVYEKTWGGHEYFLNR